MSTYTIFEEFKNDAIAASICDRNLESKRSQHRFQKPFKIDLQMPCVWQSFFVGFFV